MAETGKYQAAVWSQAMHEAMTKDMEATIGVHSTMLGAKKSPHRGRSVDYIIVDDVGPSHSHLTVRREPESLFRERVYAISGWYRLSPHDATKSGLFHGATIALRLKFPPRQTPAQEHTVGLLPAVEKHIPTEEQLQKAIEEYQKEEIIF